MKRILCIVGSMNAGGAETFLMKLYRAIDKTQYQMDFCVCSKEKGLYEDEIISMGGKIHHSVLKSENFFKSFNSIRKIVKDNKYKYVMRVSEHSLAGLDLFAAKIGGATKLVFRSSNSSAGGNKKVELLNKIFILLTKYLPNVKFAPSTEAAEFMFGRGCVKRGKAHLLNNAIEYDKYSFSVKNRQSIRKELGIGGELLIGHVGRFSKQKNHLFLIETFAEILKREPDSKLVLIGTGEYEEKIKTIAKEYGVYNNILFLGVIKDVSSLYCAMDVLLFPSIYEGMPNVIIEAQASGLRCVISNTITKEADITGLVKYMSLNESAEKWAEETISFSQNYKRKNTYEEFVQVGYDINIVADKFVQLVFGD